MLKENIKTGDWKGEKHVPVIEYTRDGDLLKVEVSVGKEVPHPNTVEHHIAWVELYHIGENGVPVLVGRADFTNHTGPATEPVATFTLKGLNKGKLAALSYCNIHGLWEGSVEVKE